MTTLTELDKCIRAFYDFSAAPSLTRAHALNGYAPTIFLKALEQILEVASPSESERMIRSFNHYSAELEDGYLIDQTLESE